MWAEERSHRIMSLLTSQARLETDRLAEALNVSRETIRRDLLKLEAEGKVRRVHGGVVPVELPPEKPFEVRRQANAAEKQRIARAAVRMLEPGQCCFVDAGTTTAVFATELAKLRGISVITNSLDVARILRDAQPEGDVLLLGGQLGADVPPPTARSRSARSSGSAPTPRSFRPSASTRNMAQRITSCPKRRWRGR